MTSLTCNYINFTTYNLHGFNQGATQLRDLCSTSNIILLLFKNIGLLNMTLTNFTNFHDSFQCIAKSAMTNKLESDILVCRWACCII